MDLLAWSALLGTPTLWNDTYILQNKHQPLNSKTQIYKCSNSCSKHVNLCKQRTRRTAAGSTHSPTKINVSHLIWSVSSCIPSAHSATTLLQVLCSCLWLANCRGNSQVMLYIWVIYLPNNINEYKQTNTYGVIRTQSCSRSLKYMIKLSPWNRIQWDIVFFISKRWHHSLSCLDIPRWSSSSAFVQPPVWFGWMMAAYCCEFTPAGVRSAAYL